MSEVPLFDVQKLQVPIQGYLAHENNVARSYVVPTSKIQSFNLTEAAQLLM